MKRQNYTVSDIKGTEADDALAEYNKWLLHPNRPLDMPIKKFKLEFEEKNRKKRKSKRNGE